MRARVRIQKRCSGSSPTRPECHTACRGTFPKHAQFLKKQLQPTLTIRCITTTLHVRMQKKTIWLAQRYIYRKHSTEKPTSLPAKACPIPRGMIHFCLIATTKSSGCLWKGSAESDARI